MQTMTMTTDPNASDNDAQNELFRRAREGDAAALNELMEFYRDRLWRMISVRMNRQLRGRVNASDLLQDAYLEASRRLPEYLADPKAPFFLWLRQIAGHKLVDAHRQHLGAQMRTAEREISLHRDPEFDADSKSLAAQLVGRFSTPSQAAVRAETCRAVEEALNAMDDIDREIICLRHFEQLNNQETADVLGITTAAASKRYIRALRKLKSVLGGMMNPDAGAIE